MGLLRSIFEWPLVLRAPWMILICPEIPHPASPVEAVIEAADWFRTKITRSNEMWPCAKIGRLRYAGASGNPCTSQNLLLGECLGKIFRHSLEHC